MDPALVAIILLKGLDLTLWGLQRLPSRGAETEAAVTKLSDMVRSGEMPPPEAFQATLDSIVALGEERDNIIALKESLENGNQ